MSQFNQSLLGSDLDHIIDQRSSPITGVLPTAIKDVVYSATCTEMDEEREVEISGVFHNANAEFTVNATKYSNLPSLGSILSDEAGRQIKVLAMEYDDANNPVQLTLVCNRRYSNQ